MKERDDSEAQDLSAEKKWHEEKFYLDRDHWTTHPLLGSRERHWLQNDVQKIRFYGNLCKYVQRKEYWGKAKILMAPVGNGLDIKYLQGIYSELHGIDISDDALSDCPGNIIKREGDILKSGYEDSSFDIVLCVLFLHPVHDIGFTQYIKEFHRLLIPGGTIAIMEPNNIYPFSWLTAMATKILGNVTGKVKGERPIFVPDLTRILQQSGFKNLRIRGLTYNHVRFPCILQSFFNSFDFVFRGIWPFYLLASHVGWFCEKK